MDRLRRRWPSREDAELVSLRIGQDHPRDITLPDIETRGTEPDQPLNFRLLIIRTEVDVKTVLAHLGPVVRNEQNSRQPTRLWLDLRDDRSVIDDHPPQNLTPPATKRNRVTGGDDHLLPLDTHSRNGSHPVTRPPVNTHRPDPPAVEWGRCPVDLHPETAAGSMQQPAMPPRTGSAERSGLAVGLRSERARVLERVAARLRAVLGRLFAAV